MIYFKEFLEDLVEKKFFYDFFAEDDVAGLFSGWHLLYIFLFAGISALLLWLSRKVDRTGERKIRLAVAIAVTAMEIVKISLRVYKNQAYDSWVPLYYCSLFIFAVWASLSPWKPLARMGSAFITMGGIAASCFFALYPSTSLALFPIWHPACMHSLVYHALMFYTGVMVMTKSDYSPSKSDSLLYLGFIFAACIPSFILNSRLGTNCMFLNHAFKLPILEPIINYSKPLYMLVVFVGQGVLLYWANYLAYRCFPKLVRRINERKDKRKNADVH